MPAAATLNVGKLPVLAHKEDGAVVEGCVVIAVATDTVIVKVTGVPVHVPCVGVTVIVDVIGDAVEFVVVKAGKFPVPEELGSPIAVAFVADQLNVVPATAPVNGVAATEIPGQ